MRACYWEGPSELPERSEQSSRYSLWQTLTPDLIEAEDIKKRWQEYTEELYKKDLHDPDNHDGAITDLEPDILECEVKWALESITMNSASGGDGIPVELFQILNPDTPGSPEGNTEGPGTASSEPLLPS